MDASEVRMVLVCQGVSKCGRERERERVGGGGGGRGSLYFLSLARHCCLFKRTREYCHENARDLS